MKLTMSFWKSGDSLPVNDFPTKIEDGFIIYKDKQGVVRAISSGEIADDRYLYVFRRSADGQWRGEWLHNVEFIYARSTIRAIKEGGFVVNTALVPSPVVDPVSGCKT